MGGTARTAACRFSIVLTLAAAALACLAAGARAGTYDVLACDSAPGGGYGSWSPSSNTDRMWTGEHCPTAGREAGGLFAGAGVNVGTIPPLGVSQQAFETPPGTSIVYFGARYMFRRADPQWRLGVFRDTTLIHGCEPAPTETGCYFNSESLGRDSTWAWEAGQVGKVSVLTACANPNGCRSDAASPTGDRAGIRLYSATVRVHDDSAPSVWDTGAGGLTDGTWQRGTREIAFAGSDNVGFRRTRLHVDGRQLRDDTRDCDFTRRRPCSDVTFSTYGVNTAGLGDGNHEVRVEGVDAAGNSGSLTTHFKSDNTAPSEPEDVAVEGGEGWRQTNRFKLTWRNPPSAAPIHIASYELCNVATGACTFGGRHADGINSIADLSVPAPGHYTVRLWLHDFAGNASSANRSDPVHLRFDDVPPGEAEPQKRNGWLNAAEAAGYEQRIHMADTAFRPVSGVPGYSVTRDGSEPDTAQDVTGEIYLLGDLAEGTTIVKARAISGSGVASRSVGSTVVRVDKSPPSVRATQPPSPDTWHRSPIDLQLSGDDQPGLSGMSGAPDGMPVEDGGYISYRVNGELEHRLRGGTGHLTFSNDGPQTVTFAAYDVAGNRSPERAVSFKIDRTAPELVVFEAPDDADPRRVVVAASDRTSGVASATVEMRRLHGGSNDRWIDLPTTRDGDRFVATVDDENVERAVYQLRARVTDRAGNEASGERRRDGSPATVDTASMRVGTKLAAALVKGSTKKTKKVCSKKKRGRKKRKCKKKTTTKPGGDRVASLNVAFGKRAAASGSLEVDGGAPLGDAVVDVYARSTAAGAEYERIAAVRTDPKGTFSYIVPAGTSRSIRFRYDGTGRYRGSEQDVTVQVAATTTIAVSRRAVRNGQSVTFHGKLRSLPIPPAGKVLDLQAFYRRKWRTFATPRAKPTGKWSYRYRFEATRGKVPYRFRALIRPESAYPYDTGYSKEVRVVVRGR